MPKPPIELDTLEWQPLYEKLQNSPTLF